MGSIDCHNSVCLLLQACFVKRTLMTVLGAPTALMVASVWTGLEATLVAVCLALLGSGVRGTSTNACPTLAARRAAWTAFSSKITTSVSAAAPSRVRTSQPLLVWCAGGLCKQTVIYMGMPDLLQQAKTSLGWGHRAQASLSLYPMGIITSLIFTFAFLRDYFVVCGLCHAVAIWKIICWGRGQN